MPGRRLAGVVIGLVGVLLGAVIASFVAAGDRPERPPEASVDVGFLRDMIDHHEQAVRMSLLVLRAEGVSPAVRDVAVGVVATQRHDVGRMEAWLDDWDHGRGAPDRPAMEWMGHRGMSPSSMPGMASAAALTELGASSGTDAEQRFLDLMDAHHEAGADMADRAATAATTDKVARLAELIAAGQREEIRELRALRLQLERALRP